MVSLIIDPQCEGISVEISLFDHERKMGQSNTITGIFYFISQFITSKRIWNIVMHTNLLIGTGMFVSLYSQEWYARQRCIPYFQNSMLDFFLPRHWFCRELSSV